MSSPADTSDARARIAVLLNLASGATGKVSATTTVLYTTKDSYGTFLSRNSITAKKINRMTYAMLKAAGHDTAPEHSGGSLVAAAAGDTFDPNWAESVDSAASVWYLFLTAAQQVSPLDDRNIESFFKMFGSDLVPWKVAEVIASLSTREVPITAAVMKANPAQNSWLTYHTAASSSAALVMRAHGADPVGLIPEADIALAKAALAAPWDMALHRAISVMGLARTSAVLDAAEMLPPKWYMGAKAVAASNPATYSKVKALAKAGLAILNKTASIGSMTTIDELKAEASTLPA